MPRTTDTDGIMFEQLRRRLTAISRRIVGSQAQAEDIVQDCFLAWHCAERDALDTPAAWLTTVVRNRSIDQLRRRSRDEAAALGAIELVPAAPPAPPEGRLLRRAALAEALARLLACLSPSERLALVLHEVFECEHAVIAAMLGTRPANTRQHLARARRRLRERMESSTPDEKLCRDLIRRFQAALDGMDMLAIAALLGGEQPMFVRAAPVPTPRLPTEAAANDLSYRYLMAA